VEEKVIINFLSSPKGKQDGAQEVRCESPALLCSGEGGFKSYGLYAPRRPGGMPLLSGVKKSPAGAPPPFSTSLRSATSTRLPPTEVTEPAAMDPSLEGPRLNLEKSLRTRWSCV